MFKLDLERAEEPEIKLPTSVGSSKKQESYRKTSISALLTMPKCRRCNKCGFNPWVGKIPWRRKWQPTPVFLPRESQGRRAWWAAVSGVAPLPSGNLAVAHLSRPMRPPPATPRAWACPPGQTPQAHQPKVFWNSLAFSMIQWMLAIWSLVPQPFLNPARTSGSSRFTTKGNRKYNQIETVS